MKEIIKNKKAELMSKVALKILFYLALILATAAAIILIFSKTP